MGKRHQYNSHLGIQHSQMKAKQLLTKKAYLALFGLVWGWSWWRGESSHLAGGWRGTAALEAAATRVDMVVPWTMMKLCAIYAHIYTMYIDICTYICAGAYPPLPFSTFETNTI